MIQKKKKKKKGGGGGMNAWNFHGLTEVTLILLLAFQTPHFELQKFSQYILHYGFILLNNSGVKEVWEGWLLQVLGHILQLVSMWLSVATMPVLVKNCFNLTISVTV